MWIDRIRGGYNTNKLARWRSRAGYLGNPGLDLDKTPVPRMLIYGWMDVLLRQQQIGQRGTFQPIPGEREFAVDVVLQAVEGLHDGTGSCLGRQARKDRENRTWKLPARRGESYVACGHNAPAQTGSLVPQGRAMREFSGGTIRRGRQMCNGRWRLRSTRCPNRSQ